MDSYDIANSVNDSMSILQSSVWELAEKRLWLLPGGTNRIWAIISRRHYQNLFLVLKRAKQKDKDLPDSCYL